MALNSFRIMLDDPNDARIDYFRKLKGNHPSLMRDGLILVEGDQQVERLLESESIDLTTLFMEPRFYDYFEQSFHSKMFQPSVTAYCAERKVMEEIIGYRLHQGCMALAKQPPLVEIAAMQGPVVLLNGINDPENVGSIVRSCVAFNCSSLVFDGDTSNPYLRRSIRVSMGGIFQTHVARCEELYVALSILRSRGFELIAVENTPDATTIGTDWFTSRSNTAIILGNERRGIDADVLTMVDRTVKIPMDSSCVSSLNVSVAAGIILSELYRGC